MAVCAAFQNAATLLTLRSPSRSRTTTTTICTISNNSNRNNINSGDGERVVRFRKESTDEPLKTFRKRSEQEKRMATPNERLLRELEESISELGPPVVETNNSNDAIADYSHVKPWAAFTGCAGAGAIAIALWTILQTLVEAYNLHPLVQSDLYVVQRLVAVVRTAVVGLLALASGISGVTSLGLFLLGGRVTIDGISNKDRNSNSNKE